MAFDPLEASISFAARDISDALGKDIPPARRRAVRDFLEMALWSATTVAEGLSASAWVNPLKDDGWTRSAADERYELPDTMTDKQFRELAEVLHLGKDTLEKSIPARIKMQPELEAEIGRITGRPIPSSPTPHPDAPLAAPEMSKPVPQKPAPKLTPEDVENIENPPKREQDIKRDNVRAPDDEFDDSIIEKPGLPGDPRSRP